jgi:small-conductance mechanosensitive channel
VFGLISEMFSLSGRMSQVNALAAQAGKIYDSNQRFRDPVGMEIRSAIRRAEQFSATEPTGDPAKLDAQRKEIDALAARFKLVAAAGVPLGEQNALIEASRQNLLNWRRTLGQEYTALLRSLLLRLGVLLATVMVVIVVSELWRRATYRYVHDARRRRQLMLIRRLAVGAAITIIIIASVVKEFGSLATFAGLITAGIAVALQTVILSGVAYFFFIGRFGVRVGDRVTITGITGDVVELGLFRLYLMELTGGKFDLRPTGRVVVFSNAVLFQPSAFYKQLPGADYVWHELSFVLALGEDPHQAEARLMAAVNSVYEEYRQSIEQQHRDVMSSLHIALKSPAPESRLKFIDEGIEFDVRYPVELRRAGEIDDKITRKILEETQREPKLKLVPKI